MTCLQNTFAFTVKRGPLQVMAATPIQIRLAKRYKSEERLVTECNPN